MQLLAGDLHTGHMISLSMTLSLVTKTFDNSSDSKVRAVCDVSLCLPCHDATADMQYDVPGLFIRSDLLT